MPAEYAAWAEANAIRGEVRLTLQEDGLALVAPLGAYQLPYAEISSFQAGDYQLRITAGADAFLLSRLGSAYEAFYDELYAAYNRKVRKALFIQGAPLFTAKGEYRYNEAGRAAKGTAPMEIYADCVLLLPPDAGARRIPLCFTTALDAGPFELTLALGTGERYSFSRLGYATEPFEGCVRQCLRNLREKALLAVKEIDPSLGSGQQAAIAALMIEGTAAPLGRLQAIAPSFADAMEARIAQSRAAEEYLAFREMGDPSQICVGIKSGLAGEKSESIPWMIAPGQKGGVAAVELALSEETAAATFLYEFPGSFEGFWPKLNQAMEAISFRREAIRLSEADLQRPAYAEQAIAVKRNAALQFIRRCYSGRVIHASPAQWRQELAAYMMHTGV